MRHGFMRVLPMISFDCCLTRAPLRPKIGQKGCSRALYVCLREMLCAIEPMWGRECTTGCCVHLGVLGHLLVGVYED